MCLQIAGWVANSVDSVCSGLSVQIHTVNTVISHFFSLKNGRQIPLTFSAFSLRGKAQNTYTYKIKHFFHLLQLIELKTDLQCSCKLSSLYGEGSWWWVFLYMVMVLGDGLYFHMVMVLGGGLYFHMVMVLGDGLYFHILMVLGDGLYFHMVMVLGGGFIFIWW